MAFNMKMQGQQRVCKKEKTKKLLLVKVLLIGDTIKVLLTGTTWLTIEKMANSGQSLMKMKFL